MAITDVQKDSVSVVIKESVIYRDTTIYVEVPVEVIKEVLPETDTSHLENYDKTTYPKWPNAQMLFDAVKGAGGEPEEKGRFNKWVLFFAMNMIHSDYGGVLSSLANGAEYAKLCYKMALAWILDPDRKHSIRHDYGLEC